MRRLLLALAALLAGIVGTRAFVTLYSAAGLPTRWNLVSPVATHPNVVNPKTKAVRYFIGGLTYSAANREAEIEAIRNSFRQWQAVPGTFLKFEEGGIINSTLEKPLDVNTSDNTNVIFWVKNSTLVNNQMDDISGASGVTFSDYFSDNSLAEADIVLNGQGFAWFTDYNHPISASWFVETVALHEIGHFIGLDHSPLGAATMFIRSSDGIDVEADLSADEVAAVRFIYGDTATAKTLARLSGQIKMNSIGIAGAAVILDDAIGNAAGGTVTDAKGKYDLPGLLPGNYALRVVPLDPTTLPGIARLTTGLDIERRFTNIVTSFLPTTNKPVSLVAGKTTTMNVAVTSGNAAFRISRLRAPVDNPELLIVLNSASPLYPGRSNVFVGVYSPNLPTTGATLSITGDGLLVGPTIFRPEPFPGLNLVSISVEVSVAANATPGLRSLIVRRGEDIAYANGFLEVQPAFPDINRDGFDDRFQRRYFRTPFNPEAAANLDKDQDGFNNFAEYLAGSNPLDAASVLRLDGVRWEENLAIVNWRGAVGRRYQLYGRSSAQSAGAWLKLGSPVTATADTVETADPESAVEPMRLYRLEAVP